MLNPFEAFTGFLRGRVQPLPLRNPTPAFQPKRRPLPSSQPPSFGKGKGRGSKFTGALLGGTGQGKSTLVNLMVNYFRGPVEIRAYLPAAEELRVAIPTEHLEATELEGAQARELDVKDRK